MASAYTYTPLVLVAVVAHREERFLKYLSSLNCWHISCVVGKRYILAHHGKHACGIGRIESAVMECDSVYLDAAYCSGAILQRAA